MHYWNWNFTKLTGILIIFFLNTIIKKMATLTSTAFTALIFLKRNAFFCWSTIGLNYY